MKMFIITAILFGLVVGGFFTVMFCQSFHHWWAKAICAVLTMAVTGVVIAGMFYLDWSGDKDQWNNGICPTCETEWIFANADRTRNGSTHYFWYCPDCGNIIDLTNQF